MPQFLEMRFDYRVRNVLAVFWLLIYVGINLPSISYLGALVIKETMGVDQFIGIYGLFGVAALYSLYGGLKAVAWTDAIQVFVLIVGAMLISYLAVDAVGGGIGFITGMSVMVEKVPEKFDLILSPGHEYYQKLPGIGVIIGGMWIANLFYWGCNQYINQRALAAKSVSEAQKGLLFAGYIKLFMPLLIIIPGIAAYVLGAELPVNDEGVTRFDYSYPWLINEHVMTGVKGLVLAALMAAIISSLASMMNSIATIFSIDLYRPIFDKTASDVKLVTVGRFAALTALLIAGLIAPQFKALDQVFNYIQEFTGLFSPGILAIFMLGMFWKKASTESALWAAILSVVFSVLAKWLVPGMAFLDQMMIIFALTCLVVVIITTLEDKGDQEKAIDIDGNKLFKTTPGFNAGAFGLIIIIWLFYTFMQ